MEPTKLSSKSQVVLRTPFRQTELNAVIGSVRSPGRSVTIEEMDGGIRRVVAKRFRRAVKR
jgi:hypothetical protein